MIKYAIVIHYYTMIITKFDSMTVIVEVDMTEKSEPFFCFMKYTCYSTSYLLYIIKIINKSK